MIHGQSPPIALPDELPCARTIAEASLATGDPEGGLASGP